MITKEELARLATLHSADGIVSAYIKVDPRLNYERGQASMKFKGSYARARRNADSAAIAALEREHDRILQYLEDWQPSTKGLAIFASEPADIWEVHEIDALVPSRVSVGPEAETAPLAQITDQPRTAVLLLDGGDARLYVGQPGSERQELQHSEELPSRHDQGGWAQARFQRHVEFHHSNVLREVADQLSNIFHTEGFDRLVLVGVDAATTEFEGLLSDPLRQRVIGRLNADFKQESDDSVIERAHLLAEEDRLSSEGALVEEAVNFAAAAGKGAAGIDDTLMALTAGNVDVLLVADGLTVDGSACLNCGYFSAHKFTRCPVCSSTEYEDLDVIDHAIDYAYLNGSQVTIATGAAAELLEARGGIAAILRYPPPVPADQPS